MAWPPSGIWCRWWRLSEFAVYYAIFRFAITRFNLKTPGRDIDTAASVEKAVAGTIGKSGYNVPAILAALGGAENIVSLDNCITVCACRCTI
ncbi:PTS transporter subunit EIIB [Klebsiella pneumoniae subsp. pneumoniae]|nr:PTS transporter subunit EIIB [Klebsiella pneumoniae subsp. pneumoniae]